MSPLGLRFSQMIFQHTKDTSMYNSFLIEVSCPSQPLFPSIGRSLAPSFFTWPRYTTPVNLKGIQCPPGAPGSHVNRSKKGFPFCYIGRIILVGPPQFCGIVSKWAGVCRRLECKRAKL